MTVTRQIGDEMAEAVGLDPIVAVALIQALMQALMFTCRAEPRTPERRMLYLAEHRPRRLKGFVRRRGRKLNLSEAEIDRVQVWLPDRIKRSDERTRKALCAEVV